MSEHPMGQAWLLWKPIHQHPKLGDKGPRVFVASKMFGRSYHFGHVYHYEDGHIRAQAEGFHGDWGITHYAELPDGPY